MAQFNSFDPIQEVIMIKKESFLYTRPYRWNMQRASSPTSISWISGCVPSTLTLLRTGATPWTTPCSRRPSLWWVPTGLASAQTRLNKPGWWVWIYFIIFCQKKGEDVNASSNWFVKQLEFPCVIEIGENTQHVPPHVSLNRKL